MIQFIWGIPDDSFTKPWPTFKPSKHTELYIYPVKKSVTRRRMVANKVGQKPAGWVVRLRQAVQGVAGLLVILGMLILFSISLASFY